MERHEFVTVIGQSNNVCAACGQHPKAEIHRVHEVKGKSVWPHTGLGSNVEVLTYDPEDEKVVCPKCGTSDLVVPAGKMPAGSFIFHCQGCHRNIFSKEDCSSEGLEKMKREDVTDKIKEIICEQMGLMRDAFTRTDGKGYNEESLFSDMGADSLDLVEFAMEFEDEFDIIILDEECEKIHTVKDAINLIVEKIK